MIALLVPALFGPGCSAFASRYAQVQVTSTDPAAVLYADGTEIGMGSATASVVSNEPHVFTAVSGRARGQVETGTRVSTIGMIDGVFGFVLLVPWIGLAFPGAHEPDRSSVLIPLDSIDDTRQ